jgi:hypothetical protein
MTKGTQYILAFIASFFLFTSLVNAQHQLSIENLRTKNCKIRFSLKNISSTNFEIPAVFTSYSKGYYVAQYYIVSEDTLEVKLKQDNGVLQSGHELKDSVIIEGKRVNEMLIIQAGEEIKFAIPSNKKLKIKVLKITISNNQIMYKDMP